MVFNGTISTQFCSVKVLSYCKIYHKTKVKLELRLMFTIFTGEDVMDDVSKIPWILNDGKRKNVIISDRSVMFLIIGKNNNLLYYKISFIILIIF